tara:strand:- start:1925 stop:2149 length:225 start_codon:yes stop_codon:yes gene_type:complete
MKNLTKREHFAGLAMESLVTSGHFEMYSTNDANKLLGRDIGGVGSFDYESVKLEMIAVKSVEMSDALLKALGDI